MSGGRAQVIVDLFHAGPGTYIGGLVAFASWVAIIPPRIRLWARLSAMAAVAAVGASLTGITHRHDWGAWATIAVLGTWLPSLAWNAQIARDQAYRLEQNLHGLLRVANSNTKSFSMAGPRFAAYRFHMTRSATSWNLLWETNPLGSGLPAWLLTRKKPDANAAALAAHLAGRHEIPVEKPRPPRPHAALRPAPAPAPAAPVLDQLMRGLSLGLGRRRRSTRATDQVH